MLLVGTILSILFSLPQTKYGSEVNISVGKNDRIEITGSEEVNVSVKSATYFLISSGDARIVDEESDLDDYFSASGVLPTSNWQIKDGSSAKVHISPVSSGQILKVHKEYSENTKLFSTGLVWIFTIGIWIIVIILSL